MTRQEFEDCLNAPFEGLNITSIVRTSYMNTAMSSIRTLCMRHGQAIRIVRKSNNQIKVYCVETNTLLWFLKRSK